MFICEFQRLRDGQFFGRSTHPSREAAEAYATSELVRLGESPEDVALTVPLASWTCADTSAFGYGVRIFDEARDR